MLSAGRRSRLPACTSHSLLLNCTPAPHSSQPQVMTPRSDTVPAEHSTSIRCSMLSDVTHLEANPNESNLQAFLQLVVSAASINL